MRDSLELGPTNRQREPGLPPWDADLPCVAVLCAAAYRMLGATKRRRGHPPANAGSDIPATRLGGVHAHPFKRGVEAKGKAPEGQIVRRVLSLLRLLITIVIITSVI